MIKKNCSAILHDDALFCHVCGKEQKLKPGGPGRKKRGNGQGAVYKQRGTWTARVLKYWYIDANDGKSRPKYIIKTGLKSKTEAIKYIATLESQVPAKKKEKKVPTLNDLFRLYEKKDLHKLSKDRKGAYKKARERLEDIFHAPIDLLGIEELQDTIDDNSSSYYTAKDMQTVLSHLYKLAIAEGHVNVNLSRHVSLPELDEKEPRKFTKEEQIAFWKLYENGDKFVRYILLMIYTGMMPGELFRIEKVHVNIAEQVIRFGIKTTIRKKTPIILPDAIMPVIKDIMSDEGHKLIHINKDNFYKQYYACLERAGCDKIPPYSCRHSTGSALGVSDIPIAVMKKLMRHKSLSSTMRYTHIDTDEMLDAANKAKRPT